MLYYPDNPRWLPLARIYIWLSNTFERHKRSCFRLSGKEETLHGSQKFEEIILSRYYDRRGMRCKIGGRSRVARLGVWPEGLSCAKRPFALKSILASLLRALGGYGGVVVVRRLGGETAARLAGWATPV